MNQWWVRYEETYGDNEKWFGPFDDMDRAEREATRLSTSIGAEDRFAELIHGERGGRGCRFREFFRGEGFSPGESGWYDRIPPQEIKIPEDAGPK